MAISRMRRYAKVIAFLTICTVGISGCGRERGAAELPFFGTWYIEKVAVISEMYTGTTKDGVAEEDLYDSEDYGLFFEDIFTVNDGGRFLPHVCDFMEEEGIDWHDDKYYGQRDGMELHLRVHIDFEETVFYETYDFIPVGTLFTLLNEDTMLVEFWGKTLLARRVA